MEKVEGHILVNIFYDTIKHLPLHEIRFRLRRFIINGCDADRDPSEVIKRINSREPEPCSSRRIGVATTTYLRRPLPQLIQRHLFFSYRDISPSINPSMFDEGE